jgi:hypothetical protein|tara:strand:- start:83 stop:262 length:180 start_codon:yes stop_codon:yes gene_type:complete
MMMADISYNLDKYLEFTQKWQKRKAKILDLARLVKRVLLEIINSTLSLENYTLNRLKLN